MKAFLLKALAFVLFPILVLLAIYYVTDPFKTLHPFSLDYFGTTNRDYLSTELFLYNTKEREYKYDSFIFGSSRCGGFNSYHWKHYLPEGSSQFVFQAWSETLTGIQQKIEYLDKQEVLIKNALIVLDIPGSFVDDQLPTKALSIKDYKLSGQSKSLFQATLFFDFLQKPSIWIKSIKARVRGVVSSPEFDVMSNDWSSTNKEQDVSSVPPKENLNSCSQRVKEVAIKKINQSQLLTQKVSSPLLTEEYIMQLRHIKSIFIRHNTNYKIIISPAIWQLNLAINPYDLDVLNSIFDDHVYDYSGRNAITEDYCLFSDPNHFGQSAGWMIIEDIYGDNENRMFSSDYE